ncbi:putative Kex2-endoproteinase of late compartment protein [Rhizoctonia solani 123E]|uniref:Putative Kex2-endoproteinase of late compartment protein n=1 Tax=Rhizoctonia solani 123E TaxID=1423351 RepID=A0A074RQ26_9AGAM|nr:putative Kex2-endoproteinase of late compartment protein [Rhizoctonia solani 123E]
MRTTGFVALALGLAVSATPQKRTYSTHTYYVLHHDPLAPEDVSSIATSLGAELVEQVGELENHWLLRAPKHNDRVMHKRGMLSLERQVLKRRVKRADNFSSFEQVSEAMQIHDPSFNQQWHLLNTISRGNDLNVSGVWHEGITGKGVTACIVDDGLDYDSEDLAPNFFAEGSYDYNDHEPLPRPKLSDDQHGTRCAGEVSAAKNDLCGVGVAYDSKIAGVRILSGPISDADEAASLNYAYQKNDIYSCSWGPPDDGRSMEAPGTLIEKAVVNGVQKGRGGKGSVFVFASGNGAGSDDQCNFDGYTNSIFSVTVAAVDVKGLHPYYSESCAANMIVAYSSGGGHNIHTTDVGKRKCTSGHGGTSAAAPLAVGVFALALQARPELTWRDIQHLCVRTALQINPNDPDWEKTAVGRPYSYKYGYGSIDAWTYVQAAKTWQLVKPQAFLSLPPTILDNANISRAWWGEMSGGQPIPEGGATSEVEVTAQMLRDRNFEKLEHVTIKVWITHGRRGDVEVELVSPKGIKSVLAAQRKYDQDEKGFPGWRFMTLKHWEEDPVGKWKIRVSDQHNGEKNGSFLAWEMSLFGSVIDPSKVELWTVPEDPVDPSATPTPATTTSSTTAQPTSTTATKTGSKQYPKPTEHLPGDHDQAEGEADDPAFGTKTASATATATTSSSSLPVDEGYFAHMTDLLKSQTWLFAALGAVVVFIIGAGVYVYRRRRQRRHYAALGGDDVPMSQVGGTRELYDAFGELSDGDESDADEERALRPRDRDRDGVRYHDGFLDDEEEPRGDRYVDVPGDRTPSGTGARSPGGDSGSGSWEHASQTLAR